MKLANSTLTLLTLLLVLASWNFDRPRSQVTDSDLATWQRGKIVNNNLSVAEWEQMNSQAREVVLEPNRKDTIPPGSSTASHSLKRTVLGREYTLHIDADGPSSQPGDIIYFHYIMRTADSVLAETREMGQEPYTQHPSEMDGVDKIDEISDVIRSLSVGDSATVLMRIDTFSSKPPGLEDVDEVFFDVVITEIVDEETFNERMQRAAAEAQTLMQATAARATEVKAFTDSVRQAFLAGNLDNIRETDSGLKYIIHKAGEGPSAESGQTMEVHYVGMLEDGTVFDQSFARGRPISFPVGVGAVISGWDEGLLLLNLGTHATLFIPAELGYGEMEQGPIPANSNLIFYVELVE